MNSQLAKLEPAPVWRLFDAICAIPHPSGHETRLAAALAALAEKNGLAVRIDVTGNLRIDRPASPGFEDSPMILLQGHLDMVPQALATVDFDFTREPIPLTVEDGWVRSAAGTTLGSDDGIGVAAAMALLLAGVMARKTDLLLLDEPASPLDPLMRDKLCQMIGEYIHEGNGKRSVFFSTHNISDMENITDYAIIMENGQIVEQGFVEDLKEKYILIKGDAADTEAAGKVLYSMTKNPYGFEGICLAENIDKLAGLNVTKEIPTLYQISVAVMKNNTKIVMR